MRLPLARCLLLALCCFAIGRAAEPLVWRLDEGGRIGGLTPERFGPPQILNEAGGAALQFNGATDGLFMPLNPLQGLEAFTIEVLFKPAADGPEAQRFLHAQDNIGAPNDPGSRALMEIRLANGTWVLDTFLFSKVSNSKLTLIDPTKRHPADQWTWVALVYDHGHMTSYVDGRLELTGEVAFPPMGAGRVSLGVRQNKVYWFKGAMREVRWHSVALKAEELQKR